MMTEMWDIRYASEDYAYGIAPNIFFKDTIDKYDLKGSILLPAEGEGRNAVYAAKKGLDVTAFDTSKEGKKKAIKLADQQCVKIKYEVGNFFDLDLINRKYDSAALIFAHFSPPLLSKYHKKIADLIKVGGTIFLEGFSKDHVSLQKTNPKIGGPTNIDLLFSKESIKNSFPNFKVIQLEETEVELNEGEFHKGRAKVIRYVGKKTNFNTL